MAIYRSECILADQSRDKKEISGGISLGVTA